MPCRYIAVLLSCRLVFAGISFVEGMDIPAGGRCAVEELKWPMAEKMPPEPEIA
jgi:hypothetical protein